MPVLRIPLRIVFYLDDEGDWIARCLEFDLCGDGATQDLAAKSLSQAIQIQVEQSIENRNLDNLFSPADGDYFRMFAAGQDVAMAELKVVLANPSPIIIESAEARAFSGSLADFASIPA